MTEVPPADAMTRVLDSASRHHVEVSFALPRVQCRSYTMTLRTTGEQILIVPAPLRACTPRAALYKRIVDVIFALIALVVFAPAMALAAIAVFLESGAPVIFRQERVGLRGHTFGMFKFRSMKHDAEKHCGPVWASEKDSRKTRTGALLRRLSLDELPQLFNVLRGEMSLVGPRPERPVFVEQFRKTSDRYDERHLVRPGITGWSQVHMKRLLAPSDVAEKLRYDLQYIESWSPFLDVSVLFQTFFEFLFHRAG
jgi:exopolysaccharide biosynthesis polyprenyl glycosylphosphotransferase